MERWREGRIERGGREVNEWRNPLCSLLIFSLFPSLSFSYHQQVEDKILELEDKIEVLKGETAKLEADGKKDQEKEKQREMSQAHDELLKLRKEKEDLSRVK